MKLSSSGFSPLILKVEIFTKTIRNFAILEHKLKI